MSENGPLLEIHKLCKKFKGILAVDNIDLQLYKGDIFGLIGPNGSGKTTFIKILATILKPTSGKAYIYGHDIVLKPKGVRGIIGYMPDYLDVYEELKVSEYLDFFAAAYKIPKDLRKSTINEAIELMDLKVRESSFVRDLSSGLKQRLCLARVILHNPEVLLLDEPYTNLDPLARKDLREILKELGSMGKIILVASNALSELANYCNKIGIINEGKLVYFGHIKDDGMNLENLFSEFVKK